MFHDCHAWTYWHIMKNGAAWQLSMRICWFSRQCNVRRDKICIAAEIAKRIAAPFNLYFECRVLDYRKSCIIHPFTSIRKKIQGEEVGEQKPPISIHSNQSINAKVVSSAGRIIGWRLHNSWKKDERGINFAHSRILNNRTSYMESLSISTAFPARHRCAKCMHGCRDSGLFDWFPRLTASVRWV